MHCAVIMPQPWRGGMLNFAILLSNLAAKLMIESEPVSVSLCVPEGYDRSRIVGLNSGINVIETRMASVSRQDARMRPFTDTYGDDPFAPWAYTAPDAADGSIDIALADVWLMLTGLLNFGPLAPVKPYLVYLPDLIQRLVPEIYGFDPYAAPWVMNGWQALTLQRSQGVIVTTAKTGLDVVSYAGVPKCKVHTLPMVHAPLFNADSQVSTVTLKDKEQHIQRFLAPPSENQRPPRSKQRVRLETPVNVDLTSGLTAASGTLARTGPTDMPYFLWVTNTTAHKNHLRALAALEIYYTAEHGRLPCVMCGPLTDCFRPDGPEQVPYVEKVKTRIRESGVLKEHLIILGELGHEEFRSVLTDAAYLWHNVLYDNGTFSVIDAALVGTRSLVSRYPQMLEICELYSIDARTFDPWSPDDAAKQLKAMEASLIHDGVICTCKRREDLTEMFSAQLCTLLEQAITRPSLMDSTR